MNRRKDGRELFEVFKEQVAAASAAVKKEAPVFRAEPKVVSEESAIHTLKLGDRRQVEIFLSMGWVYGAIFFIVLLAAFSFAVGRHFAVTPEVVEDVQAPPAAVSTLQQVGDVQQLAPPTAGAPPPARPQGAAQQQAPSAPAGASAQAPTPAGAVKVSGGGMYTLCVVTYFNKGNAKAAAQETAKFLSDKGFPDVRVLTDASKARLIVAVGRFATKNGADVSTMKAHLASTTYKTTRFDKSFVAALKGYQ